LTERIIGACIEVHRFLGPGLLESTYESCLAHELQLLGLDVRYCPYTRCRWWPISSWRPSRSVCSWTSTFADW